MTEQDVTLLKDFVLRPMIQGRDTAHMLRAAFHDSVGGSDGCLNRDVAENSGFDDPPGENFIRIVDRIDAVYDSLVRVRFPALSRADFYVMAGEVAVENAFVNAEVDLFPLASLSLSSGIGFCDLFLLTITRLTREYAPTSLTVATRGSWRRYRLIFTHFCMMEKTLLSPYYS